MKLNWLHISQNWNMPKMPVYIYIYIVFGPEMVQAQ